MKGGGAWTDEQFSATCNSTGAAVPPNLVGVCTNPAGATATAEADYVSFGDTNLTASDGSPLTVGMHFWEEKIGVNYRF